MLVCGIWEGRSHFNVSGLQLPSFIGVVVSFEARSRTHGIARRSTKTSRTITVVFYGTVQFLEQFLGRAGNNTHGTSNILFIGTGRTHGIGLAGTRLTVRQKGDIVTLQERVDTVAEILPHALLVDGLCENAIEDEQLAALRDIDSDTGGCRDMNHGTLEPLRN